MTNGRNAGTGLPGDLVSFVTTDWAAITRGRAVPLADVERWLAKGCGWVPANAAITPFDPIAPDNPWGSSGDLRLLPDPAAEFSVRNLPGAAPLHVYQCDIVETDGTPWSSCPRTFLRRAIDDLAALGFRVVAAFEHEFQLIAAGWAAPAFSLQAQRQADPLGPTLIRALDEAGAEPETFLPEYGPHQFEITCRAASALTAADRAVVIRELSREVARLLGRRATFAPRTTAEGVGNGVHVHLGLTDLTGKPVMHDGANPGRISAPAGRFAAGVIHHLPALCAFTAPSVISYARLVPHHWSAAWTCFGDRNREATLRICPTTTLGGGDPAAQLHFEYRALDATACPHLALGVILRAGIEGLRAELPAPPLVNTDPGLLSDQERERLGVHRLPASQTQALAALEADAAVPGWFSAESLAGYRAMRAKEREIVAGLDLAGLCARYAAVY
jgi:glutamine synthetase